MIVDYRILSLYDVPEFPFPSNSWGLAVDIGTTTIVLALVGPAGVGAVDSFLNPQRLYGKDVLSRVRAATMGKADRLRELTVSALSAGINRLIASASVDPSKISRVSIAANTVMCHLLLGLPVAGLGVAPFTPDRVVFDPITLADLLRGSSEAIPSWAERAIVRVAPAVGAFVGGDVLAGLAACEIDALGEPILFVDLGTNAEMILSVSGSFKCASAAAGPAFEGGSVSCGTGSVPGAVSSVRLEGSRFSYDTIGNVRPPVGICGSGLLSFLSASLEAGLVGRDGSLAPVCAQSGVVLDPSADIRLTAEDVRELQLAKAAIRAGLETLLESSGIPARDVARTYFAGGFGRWLDVPSALDIGLLPPGLGDRVVRPGNTALAGAVRWVTDESFGDRLVAIASSAQTVQLADSPSFARRFVDAMEFS